MWSVPRDCVAHCRRFGLEDLEDPLVAVPDARPVWPRSVLPSVLTANGRHLRTTGRVSIIGRNETEHLLFSDGRHFLRIGVIEGTLIGCPSSSSYLLRGLTHLQGPIASLNRLAASCALAALTKRNRPP
jgi:hypothetical protein